MKTTESLEVRTAQIKALLPYERRQQILEAAASAFAAPKNVLLLQEFFSLSYLTAPDCAGDPVCQKAVRQVYSTGITTLGLDQFNKILQSACNSDAQAALNDDCRLGKHINFTPEKEALFAAADRVRANPSLATLKHFFVYIHAPESVASDRACKAILECVEVVGEQILGNDGLQKMRDEIALTVPNLP